MEDSSGLVYQFVALFCLCVWELVYLKGRRNSKYSVLFVLQDRCRFGPLFTIATFSPYVLVVVSTFMGKWRYVEVSNLRLFQNEVTRVRFFTTFRVAPLHYSIGPTLCSTAIRVRPITF